MRPSLARLTLLGFKTIRELKDFEPGPMTVLIGPNGAGKTNFISFFRMLSRALTPPGELQNYVVEQGGANALLHDGLAKTHEIQAEIEFRGDAGADEYGITLSYAADDTLIFGNEWYAHRDRDWDAPATRLTFAHREAKLIEKAEAGDLIARRLLKALRGTFAYQFHNTSISARIRNKWAIDDGAQLKEDGANLASFLYRLEEEQPKYYGRISETLRLILPFFGGFDLKPEARTILLRWHERGSDQVFSASQAADGMLRIMALVAVLQQPENKMPTVLILDEPELGLHPYAIEVLASLIQSASYHTQIIVATQSVSLIDRFEPHDIVVVERAARESTFRRLDDSALASWRERYTMSELWEKNVLGGRP